mgnify:CR=1 FL=1
MDKEELERFTLLSEKALNETATLVEIEEFQCLLNLWNSAVEQNLCKSEY